MTVVCFNSRFVSVRNPGTDGHQWPVFTPEHKEYVTLTTQPLEMKEMLKSDQCHFWNDFISKMLRAGQGDTHSHICPYCLHIAYTDMITHTHTNTNAHCIGYEFVIFVHDKVFFLFCFSPPQVCNSHDLRETNNGFKQCHQSLTLQRGTKISIVPRVNSIFRKATPPLKILFLFISELQQLCI